MRKDEDKESPEAKEHTSWLSRAAMTLRQNMPRLLREPTLGLTLVLVTAYFANILTTGGVDMESPFQLCMLLLANLVANPVTLIGSNLAVNAYLAFIAANELPTTRAAAFELCIARPAKGLVQLGGFMAGMALSNAIFMSPHHHSHDASSSEISGMMHAEFLPSVGCKIACLAAGIAGMMFLDKTSAWLMQYTKKSMAGDGGENPHLASTAASSAPFSLTCVKMARCFADRENDRDANELEQMSSV